MLMRWAKTICLTIFRCIYLEKYNETCIVFILSRKLNSERFIICIKTSKTRKIFSNWVISEPNLCNWILVGNATQRNIKTNKWAIKCTRYFIQPWWKHNAFYFIAHVRIRKYLCIWKNNSKPFEYSM